MKFEEKIIKLEKIVDELENGEIDLDQSISKYTEAMKLIKECDEELKKVETKVNKIVASDGTETEFNLEKE